MFDVKDKKILSELMLDARIPITKLAKKVGVSREVANYRIKKLEEKQTIKGYYVLVNYEALGFSRQVIFLQLKGVNSKQEKEIINKIANHEYTTYLSPIIGKWNVVFDILTKNEKMLEKVVKEIITPIQQYVDSFILITSNTKGEFFPTKFLGIKKDNESVNKTTKPYELDDLDKNILRELSKNARTDYILLSNKLDVPATTIAFRVKKLQKNNILQGSTISIDYKHFGWDFYNLQLKSQNTNLKEFFEFVKEHNNIIFYYEYLGHENWDIDLGIIAKNTEELKEILIEIKQKFGEEIQIQNMYAVSNLLKDNIVPEGVLK